MGIYTSTGFDIITDSTTDGRIVYAFILALLGLGASFFESRKSTIIASGSGCFGAILLLWITVETTSNQFLVSIINYEIGFWSVLLLFFGVAFINFYLLK
jgi:lipopolysaccharide export LptBFGC system permease protein LptF